MTQYVYHTWDALNYYDKKGYSLHLIEGRFEWTDSPSSNSIRVGGVYSFKTSEGETYSRIPTYKLAQYSAEFHI